MAFHSINHFITVLIITLAIRFDLSEYTSIPTGTAAFHGIRYCGSRCATVEIPERNAAVPAGGRMGRTGTVDDPGHAGQLGDLPGKGLPDADDGATAKGHALSDYKEKVFT